MRIATSLVLLGCLLVPYANLVHAHQPTTFARAGLEKRAHLNEPLWTDLANRAESTVKALASNAHLEFPPEIEPEPEQAIVLQNRMLDRHADLVAAKIKNHGRGVGLLASYLDARRQSTWSRRFPLALRLAESYPYAGDDVLSRNLVDVRDAIFKLLENAPKPEPTKPFMDAFRTVAHAYEVLYHVRYIQSDHQPTMQTSSILEPKMGWQEIIDAGIDLRRDEEPRNLAALAEEGDRLLEKSLTLLQELESTISEYERRFPGDLAMVVLDELLQSLRKFRAEEGKSLKKIISHNNFINQTVRRRRMYRAGRREAADRQGEHRSHAPPIS